MTPDQFRAVRDIFDVVVALPVSSQREQLKLLAADDEVLRGVEALLNAAAKIGDTRISAPLNEMLLEVGAPLPKQGDQFGVWRVAAEIGHGGMGSVYLVNRADGHFEQTAALKFLKGMPSEQRLAYFARERQLLATLTHPNIARLLDGGATPQSQPYLVMEYVDGLHIDQYCARHQLDTRAILQLFVLACEAVDFAHRQLIIHCDLKPSNLLVNGQGRPVLLDFGIARLAENLGNQSGLTSTHSGDAYSPRYASPEQRERGVVSIASDIFSLGIMLDELLRAANVDKKKTGTTNAVDAQLDVALDVELRALLSKACATNSAERYATVGALTDDIKRYLAHYPLQALPPTSAYIAKKLVQRQWPWLLAATAFAATVLGFTIKVTLESQRARLAETEAIAQRDRAAVERDRAVVAERTALTERDATKIAEAEALKQRDSATLARDRATAAERNLAVQRNVAISERDRARRAELSAVDARDKAVDAKLASKQVSDFMVSVFRSSSPSAQAGDIPASTLLTEAEVRLDNELLDRPQVQAELFNTLSFVRRNMGAAQQAVTLSERAIAIERAQARPLVLAEMLFQLSDALSSTGNNAKAIPSAKEALALREQHAASGSIVLGRSLSQVGHLLAVTGERAEGGKLLRRAVDILDKSDDTHSLAYTLANISVYHFQVGEMAEAESTIRRAFQLRAMQFGSDHPTTNKMREDVGFVLSKRGTFQEAELMLRQSVEVWIKLFGRNNASTARAMNRLGDTLVGQGRLAEALTTYKESLEIIGTIDGKQSARYNLTRFGLGLVEMRQEDYLAAEATFAAALPYIRQHLSPKEDNYARFLGQLGLAKMRSGKLEAASPFLLEAYDLVSTNRGENRIEITDYQLHLAEWAILSGKQNEAAQRLARLQVFLPFKDAALASRYAELQAKLTSDLNSKP
jgi:eukaryotic-like serine/threonine-protein kinase